MGQAKKDGLSWGCLVASVLPLLHAVVFVAIGVVIGPVVCPTCGAALP